MPLLTDLHEHMERRIVKNFSNYHVCFDNVYYSVDCVHLHKEVLVQATASALHIRILLPKNSPPPF